jgi:hypothetical protein
MTKTRIWLPVAFFAALALALTGVLSSGDSAEADHGDHGTFTVASASVAPSGNVSVDVTFTPNPDGASEAAGTPNGCTAVEGGVDNDSDGHIDDGCGTGTLDMTVAFNASEVTVTCNATQPSGVICNSAANPIVITGASTTGFTGVTATLDVVAGSSQLASVLDLTVNAPGCTDLVGGQFPCTAVDGTITITAQQPTTPAVTTAPATTAPAGATTPAGATSPAATTRPAGTTPAGLPQTGGSDDGSSSIGWILAALGVTGAAAAAWATMRLRRTEA